MLHLATGSILTARRPLIAALALALLVLPLAAGLNHPVHESADASPIHTEAAHPDAPPHFDREEHLPLEECMVCVHSARLFAHHVGLDWQPAGHRELDVEPAQRRLGSLTDGARRSRAPPA